MHKERYYEKIHSYCSVINGVFVDIMWWSHGSDTAGKGWSYLFQYYLSLYQTGKYDLYLDEPEYQYKHYGGEKAIAKKKQKAELAVVDAKEFGEEYHLLPVEYYDLDGSNFNFKGDDVLRMVICASMI